MAFYSSHCLRSFTPRRRLGLFVSYTLEDVPQSLLSTLMDPLRQNELPCMVWMDYWPPRTTPVDKEILRAIEEESRYAVVFLSTNYACYPWCLDQLVKIMLCNKDKEMIVFPVFYHVDALDVYSQTGTFGEHWNQLIGRTRGDQQAWSTRLQAWSYALRAIASIQGGSWHLAAADQSEVEGKAMEEIAQKISSGLEDLSSSATVSSLSLSSSLPPRPRIKYDVFVAWTRDDITNDFRERLLLRLRQKEIFMTVFLNHINDSTYAIVVFSKDHASDPEYLDELVNIVKCKRERGLIVLPVFYHVDPSNVYGMNGTFGERFGQHIGGEKNRSRVQAWSYALKEVAKIPVSWYLFGDPGEEKKSIEDIVQMISSGLGRESSDADKNVLPEEPCSQETEYNSSDHVTDHINPHVFDMEPLSQEFESFPAVALDEVEVEDKKQDQVDRDAVDANEDEQEEPNDRDTVDANDGDEEDDEEDEKVSVGSSRMYEVFLSFRGVDTRKNIVGHLYDALVRRGINTYKDNINLERGSLIRPELERAISESKLAVIVFSKSHCSSSWCLDEVKFIMNCMKTRGQIVIPVFYQVEPTDVRKQTGPFKKDFDEQKQEKKDEWKQPLSDAANLAGWAADGDESKLIKDIVDDISSKLNRLPPSVDKNLIGIGRRMNDVLDKVGSDGVRMIGIWGMPGAGKTTVARAAFHKIFNDFSVRSFVEDVREVSEKNELIFLQQKILSLVDEKLKVDNLHQGIELLKKRLCSRKVLLVLDDVANRKQLDALAGARDWFGEGSRIFITTRDKDVLQGRVDEISEAELLSENEANQLVNQYAFGANKPKKGFEKLSGDLVKYACGLPLALEVLGAALRDKKLKEWESAVGRLKNVPHKEILEKLRISFDALSDDEKELFLYLACFFKGWKYDKVVRILDSCECYPIIGIKILQQKSLLTVSNERIQMHNLIQEMGKSIGGNSRLWHSKKISDVVEEDESMKEIKAIVTDDPLEQPDVLEAFSKMKKLGLLRVTIKPRSPKEMAVQGPCSLPNGLRWLSMHNYTPKSLPESFRGSKLVGLEMLHGSIGEIKGLGKLKFLDLSFSKELTTTPDFTGIPNLERLVLQECENLVEIHQSIGVLKCIVHISLRGCRNLTKLPHYICELPCLKSLDLKHCSRLEAIPVLPSSIAILEADYCESLTSVQGLSKNYDWLWKVSFLGCSSLLKNEESQAICAALSDNILNQGNAVVDHWISILLPDKNVLKWSKKIKLGISKWLNKTGNASIKLRISPNESNDILGVSLCVVGDYCRPQFRILLSTEDNSIIQSLPGSKRDPCGPYTWQCYLSFQLLKLSFTGSKWADWIKTTTDIFLIISPVTTDVDIRGASLVHKEDVAEKSTTTDSSMFGEKTRLVCSEEKTNGNSATLLIGGEMVCLEHSSMFKWAGKSDNELDMC